MVSGSETMGPPPEAVGVGPEKVEYKGPEATREQLERASKVVSAVKQKAGSLFGRIWGALSRAGKSAVKVGGELGMGAVGWAVAPEASAHDVGVDAARAGQAIDNVAMAAGRKIAAVEERADAWAMNKVDQTVQAGRDIAQRVDQGATRAGEAIGAGLDQADAWMMARVDEAAQGVHNAAEWTKATAARGGRAVKAGAARAGEAVLSGMETAADAAIGAGEAAWGAGAKVAKSAQEGLVAADKKITEGFFNASDAIERGAVRAAKGISRAVEVGMAFGREKMAEIGAGIAAKLEARRARIRDGKMRDEANAMNAKFDAATADAAALRQASEWYAQAAERAEARAAAIGGRNRPAGETADALPQAAG